MDQNPGRSSALKSISAYAVGFILSLLLTLEAYWAVTGHVAGGQMLTIFLLILAFTQMVVQFVFFLHVGQETKSQWNLFFLATTAGIIFMVVVGSIWIMDHLNYRMMPMNVNQVIMRDENIYK